MMQKKEEDAARGWWMEIRMARRGPNKQSLFSSTVAIVCCPLHSLQRQFRSSIQFTVMDKHQYIPLSVTTQTYPIFSKVRDLASKKAAVIFTKSSCCMCYSIKTLFYDLGASPAIHELDRDPYGREMERALRGLGCDPSVPAVFIGGRFVGSSKDIISLHVDGSLKQMLIDAKAIWF
ncbi:hypothetical protein V6N13_137935 [Hibiscus sabdariffa]|uniref:Glutaredoxin domain-containing protein n=1 Tax=Hibiscus sabdariffa TaxID=183260 RepID=A0ABR2QC00_9ROSI